MTAPETPPDPRPHPGGPEAPDIDEAALIRRCQAGEVAAFEPLVEKYRQRVWRLAYQVLRDREEAWDCAQEAFVRAFQSLRSFRGQAAFYTWLFRITMNLATDRHRARGARARAFGAERVPEEEWGRTQGDPGEGPDTAALRAEQRERIMRGLDALPPKLRTIIMLGDVEGLTYREIADVLDCPIGTVMSRLHNARKRLKAILGPMLALVLGLLTALLLAGPADAQQVIRFGVRVLQASNPPPTPRVAAPPGGVAPRGFLPPGTALAPSAPPERDERVEDILPRLRTLFRYSEYTTLERHRGEAALGAQQRFPIPGQRWLEVTPQQMHGASVQLSVRLLRGESLEIRTSIVAAPGAPAVLGGPRHGDGVLIIILWAEPTP